MKKVLLLFGLVGCLFIAEHKSVAGPFTGSGYLAANAILARVDWKASCMYLEGETPGCKDFGALEIFRGVPYIGGLMDAATIEEPKVKFARTISRNAWLLLLQALSLATAAEKAASAAEATKVFAQVEGATLVVGKEAEKSMVTKLISACSSGVECSGDWIQKVVLPKVDKILTLIIGIDRSSEAVTLLKAFIYGEFFNVSTIRDFSEGAIASILPDSLSDREYALLNTALKVFTGVIYTTTQYLNPGSP